MVSKMTKSVAIGAAIAAAAAATYAGYKYAKKRGLDKKAKAVVKKELAKLQKRIKTHAAKAESAFQKALDKQTKAPAKKSGKKTAKRKTTKK